MPQKRKDGIWKRGNSYYVDMQINGQRIVRSFGSERRLAEAAVLELKKQKSLAQCSGEWSQLAKLAAPRVHRSFDEAAGAYLQERPTLKAATLRGYHEIWKNYWSPQFGAMAVDQITEEDLTRFQAELQNKLSSNRSKNIMGFGKYVLKFCHKRRWIHENPTEGMPSITIRGRNEIDPFTEAEITKALAKMHEHYRPLFICLEATGCRPNELLALKWKDINFERAELKIRQGRVRGIEDDPKTASAKRTIPIPPKAMAALESLRGQQQPSSIDRHVFLTRKGQPINKHMDRIWREALKKAGIRHRSSYQLRHTYATKCLQNGIDPLWLARILGHRDATTTFKHYAAVIQTDANVANRNRLAALYQNLQQNCDIDEGAIR